MSDELEQTTELDLDKAGEDIMDGVLGEDRERPEPVEEVVEEKKARYYERTYCDQCLALATCKHCTCGKPCGGCGAD